MRKQRKEIAMSERKQKEKRKKKEPNLATTI